eukprot:714305-Pleurochrysis_carterae.AAC.1
MRLRCVRTAFALIPMSEPRRHQPEEDAGVAAALLGPVEGARATVSSFSDPAIVATRRTSRILAIPYRRDEF